LNLWTWVKHAIASGVALDNGYPARCAAAAVSQGPPTMNDFGHRQGRMWQTAPPQGPWMYVMRGWSAGVGFVSSLASDFDGLALSSGAGAAAAGLSTMGEDAGVCAQEAACLAASGL